MNLKEFVARTPLTQPKRRNYTGSYKLFLQYDLPKSLSDDDIPRMLDWLRENSVSVASSRRYCSPKFLQQLSCNPWILQFRSLSIDRDRQHTASNVASHGLRVNQVRGRDDNSDAHLRSEVYIGHYRDLLNVRGASETLKRLRHVRIQWRCQPTPQRRL